MGQIEFQFFDNLRMYHSKSTRFDNRFPLTIQHPSYDINLSINDFHRYSHDLGNYEGNQIDGRSRKFYASLVNYMVELLNDRYNKRKDFEIAETSIISSLNYFMGMIASKVVASKEYGVQNLYHLSDNHNLDILYDPKSNKRPDFIGLDDTGKPFILEAKGTYYGKLSTKISVKAYDQLEAIDQVNILDNHGFPRITHTDLDKHIVISTYYKNGNEILTFQDIDPESKGEEILDINLNLLTYAYYENYMLDLLNNPYDTKVLYNNITIVKTELPEYEIGLDKRIFNELLEYKNLYLKKEKLTLSNLKFSLYENINNYLSGTKEIPYYYKDGVYFKYKSDDFEGEAMNTK